MRKIYAGTAEPVQIVNEITATNPANGQNLYVSSIENYPTELINGGAGYFVVAVGRQRTLADGTSAEEKMLVTLGTDEDHPSFVLHGTYGRGYDGTEAKTHVVGELVEHVVDADSMTDFSHHMYDTTRDDHTQYVLREDYAPFDPASTNLTDFSLENHELGTYGVLASYTWHTIDIDPAVSALIWRLSINSSASMNWSLQVRSQPAGAGDLMFEAVGIGSNDYSISWPWVYQNDDNLTQLYVGVRNIAGADSTFSITELRGKTLSIIED